MGKRKILEDSNELITKIRKEYLEEVKSVKELATIYNCSTAVIQRFLNKHCIKRNGSFNPTLNERQFITAQLALGRQHKDIASDLGVKPYLLNRYINREILHKGKYSNKLFDDSWILERTSLFWYFLGLFSADGHLGTNNIVSIRRVSTQKFNSRKQFVSTLENTYRELLTKRGYNPDFASILVAQDANESGWGKNLAGNFNYGGIKSKTGPKKKTTEYINGVKQTYYDSFRDFNSLEDFCNFKRDLLSSSRYNIFNTTNPDNPEEVFIAINTRGYSTTPNHIYVPQLLKVYNNVIQLS